MERREKFVWKGESQMTQNVNRSGVRSSNYDQNFALKSESRASNPDPTDPTDHEGDVVMGSMKLDLQSLASMIAALEVENQGKQNEVEKLVSNYQPHGASKRNYTIL
ncbi:hypothetical protein K3495_g14390 [Podosphaera aphanis]|nr:hypothetical protein K3495_g14390 [Podosphaera aphanis]